MAYIGDLDRLQKKMASIGRGGKSRAWGGKRGKRTPAPRRKTRAEKAAMGTPINFGNLMEYIPPKPPKAKSPIPSAERQAIAGAIRKDVEAFRDKMTAVTIAQTIAELPPEMVEGRVQAIALGAKDHLEMAKREVKEHLKQTKRRFQLSAGDYQQLHLEATRRAMDDKQFDVAARSSQWALEKMQEGDVRVIEKTADTSGAPKIMIGVQLGGIPQLPVITQEPD